MKVRGGVRKHLETGSLFRILELGDHKGRTGQVRLRCVWAGRMSGDQIGAEFWASQRNVARLSVEVAP